MDPELIELSQLFLRQYSRPFVRYFLNERPLSHRMNVIKGQRGIGKTTAAVQHILSRSGNDMLSSKILYVPCDHFKLRGRSLYDIAEEFYLYGGQIVCFDEVHKYPDWSGELKSAHDTFTALEILATGSSALEIVRGSHDLSRRALVHTMYGMSFREFIEMDKGVALKTCSLSDIIDKHERLSSGYIETLAESNLKILPLFEEYLRHGYYPFFIESRDEETFFTLLERNVHTSIEIDLVAVSPNLTGESIRRIKQLLSFIASAVPFMPDYSSLKQAVNVSDQRTIRNYLELLQRVGVLRLLPRTGSVHESMKKPEKIYLDNTSQMFALAPGAKADAGTLRETFFASQLGFSHRLGAPKKGDFLIDDALLFEIGGKSKKSRHIAGHENVFYALDRIETGSGNRIPLWLFGFTY